MRIIYTRPYERKVKKLLSEAEREEMETSIVSNPLAHPVITGTGGARKARAARGASGKSGGVRAIYYFQPTPEVIFMFTIFAKNEQENLTSADKQELKKLIEAIKKEVK